MSGGRLQFPRLNLARAGAVSFAISASYRITEERLALLTERAESQIQERESSGVVSAARYKLAGGASPYLISAISHVARELDEVHMTISYREIPADTPRRRHPGVPERRFVDIVGFLGTPSEVDCHALFEFGDRPPNELWFPLPVNLAGATFGEAFEVRGVRAAKLATDSSEPEYQFILDRPLSNQVVVQVDRPLRIEASIIPDTVRTAFQLVHDIAGKLVGKL